MKLLEISNWYSQNLEQISISISSGETWILLGDDSKKDIISGILGHITEKQGKITYYSKETKGYQPWGVFAEDFLPEYISPREWGRVFGGIKDENWGKIYNLYLEKLNLPPNIPLLKQYDRYKCALALVLSQKLPLFLVEFPNLDKMEEKEEVQQWKQSLRDCFRVMKGEKSAKIISSPSLSALEPWCLEEGKIGIFSGKNLLLQGTISDLELEKLTCSIAQYKAMSPLDYVWKKPVGDEILLVREKRENMLSKTDDLTKEPCSLGECMKLIQEKNDDV